MVPGNDIYEAAKLDGVPAWRGFPPGNAAADHARGAGGGRVPGARRAACLRHRLRVLTPNTDATRTMSVYARENLFDFDQFAYGSAASTLAVPGDRG